MAKYGKSLAQVVVEINGKQQVQQVLKAMEESAEKLRAKIDQTKKELEELAKGGTSPEYTKKLNDLKQLEAEEKQINRSLSETKKLNLDINDVLANMSEYTATTLAQTRRKIEATLRLMKPVTEEQRQQMQDMLQDVRTLSDEINRRMGKLTEFEDIMNKITHVDDRSLDTVIKRLKDLIATTDKLDSENLIKYTEQLSEAEDEKRRRVLDEGKKTLIRNQSSTYRPTTEMAQADIKVLEEYKKLLRTDDTEGLEKTNKVIDLLKQNIKETESGFMSFEKAMEKAQGIMAGTFDPTLDDLEKIQKVLKEGMQDKFHIANPEDEAQLKKTLGLMEDIRKKQQEVMRLNHQDKVNAVSKDLYKVSPAEIEEAVKASKELQQVAKSKEEFIQLGEFIGKAEARLKDWNETAKQSVMKSQIKDLSDIRALSDGALQDQLKFWEGTMNAAKKTSTAYKEAKKNFEDLQAESKRRLQFEGEKTIKDVNLGIGDGSIKQMQERLKLLQDYRAVIDGTKSDAYKAVDEAILKLTEDIKAGQAGFLSFDKALEKAQGVMDGTFKPTLEDLEKIQKVLKEGMQSKFNLVDDADIDKLKETRRLMDEMAKKQAEADRIRLKDQAQEIMGGSYTKTIEGTKQAIELLKKYQDTLDTTNPDAINEVTKSINKMKEELESASRAKAAEVMANPMRFSADEINEAIKLTEKLQAATNNATVWENYEQQLIKAREARDRFADDSKYKAMVKQFEDLEDLTANAWTEQKKYWEAMRDSGKYYDEAIEKLKEMQELETTRMKDSSTKILTTDLLTAGTGDIKQSVEWLTKYQASLEPLGDKWTNINNLIKAGEERLKSISETVSKQNLSEQAGKIMGGDYTKTIEGTKQAIELLKKYQQTLDATDTTGINKVEESIKKMREELDTVTKKNARETLTTNLKVAGTEDIKQAVDWLTKYQGTLKPLSPLWKKINKEIEAGNERLKELSDGKKMAAMSEQFKKYKDLSVNALAEQKKYWTEVKNTHAETDKEYKRAVARLEKIDQLEKSRTKAEATPLITEATSGSWDKTIEETEKAIKLIQEYKKQLHTSTDTAAIADADKAIEALNANLKKGKEGLMDFGDAIAKAKTIAGGTFSGTLEDLEKLQKAIKEGINTELDITSDADIDRLKEAQKLLEDIAQEQQKAARARLEEQAKDTQAQVKAGTYKGTIEETEKAIELQKQYMKLLDTTDAAGIKDVEDTIEALQQKLKQAKDELMSYEKAMAEVDKMNKGTWKGTLEDLEKIKKSLEYHKKNKLEVGGDSKGLKDIEKALREIEKTGKGAHMSMKDIDELLKHLDSASVEKLTVAAKELQDQLQDAVRGTQEYAETAAKLREVNLELKKAKKEWEGQENVITRTAKRLMAYVAVYGGFNEIVGKMKEMIQMNLQLSDSMADVQKTTGLTGVELQELGRSLERIDTRTTTAELYQLAAAAGQIGLKTQEDVLGFAKAANTISVALNELGAEGSASLMKIATLTGEVERYGTEQALTRVGSAINELTANSAATAGPIADFISRVGGIASASKMAISEMAALGAATDASAQSIEIAGTSMNKFITALLSNTENIAYATNLNAQELQTLITEGNTMQAVIRVLESMQTMDRSGISAAMKELGSEGARMNQYIASMVSNLDMLKAQLALSKEAFEENVSVVNEYNVKQESALGILQRMRNNFMDTFVNSKMTVILKDILQTIAAIPHWLEQNRLALLAVRIVIAQIIAFKIPFLLNALMKNLWGMYGLLSGPMINALTSFKAAWAKARFEIYKAERAMGASVAAATAATRGFQGFARVLGAFVSANWLGLILAGVGLLSAAIYHFTEETDKVAKATAELTKKHTRQIEELNALRAALDATNTSYAVKAAAMKEINSLYSKYLGFELSELDNYEKKKAALDYINAKLKENQTLELAARQKEVYTEQFGKDTQKSVEGLTKGLMAIPEIGANRLTEAMNVINDAVKNGSKDISDIIDSLEAHFKTDLSEWAEDHLTIENNAFLGLIEDDPFADLENYVEKYSTLQQQLAGTDEYYNGQKLENQRISDEALERLADEHKNKLAAIEANHQEKIEKLQKEGSAMTEAEQIAHLQALLKEQEQYQKTAEKMLQRAKEKDEETISRFTNKDTKEIDLGNMHAYYRGETKTIVSTRVNELNDLRAQMAKVRKQMAEDEKALNEAIEKLRIAEQKENNEQEIQLAKDTIEAKRKAINDGNESIIRNEMKWNTKYAELQTWATSDAHKKWRDTVEDIGGEIESLKIRIAGDPWGKGFNVKNWKDFGTVIENLDTSSIDALAAAYKKLREESMTITADVEAFNKMFDPKTPKKNLDELNEQVLEWANQLRQELASRGRGVTGEFLFGEGKDGYDQVLEQLKTHFLKQQKQLRESYLKGLMTGPELKRRLEANNKEFANARVELNKLMLGLANHFDQTLYPELAEANLSKLARTIFSSGEEIRSQIEQSLEEDQNAILEKAIQTRESLEKEFNKTSPFRTLDDQFKDTLDNLGLMSSEFERQIVDSLSVGATEINKFGNMIKHWDPLEVMGLDAKNMEKRFDIIKEYASRSYTVDAEGLRDMMREHQDYDNWIRPMKTEQLEYLLQASRWYYDQELLAVKNYTSQLKKEYDSMYNQLQLKMSDSGRAQWEIEQLQGKLLAPNLEEGQRKAIIARINELEKIRDDARKKEDDKNKSHRNKMERETKDEMESSISALEAYYNEQEAMIRKRGLELNLTDEEIERQVLENSIKRQEDLIQLRKKLLGDESTFDPFANEGYKGAITGNVFFGDNKNEEILKRQAEQIKVWGKALTDGMRNQIAKSNIEIQKEAQKLKEKIQNILLDKQFVKKAVNEMQSSFDQIDFINESTKEKFNFLWGNTDETKRTQEAADARMKVLMQYSEDVYSEESEAFKKRLLQDSTFGSTVAKMNEEEYTAFLVLLQQYHDKVISAEKQHADERKRIIDQQWEEEGYQSGYEAADRTIGIAEDNLNTMQNAGAIANEQEFFDQYQQLVLNRVALEQWAYEQKKELYKKNNATQEQFQQLDLDHAKTQQEFQQKLLDNYIARYQKMADVTTSYGNIIGDGFGRMIAGEKDAGKQLIKNLLTETIQMASQFAQRLILQSTFGAQMESIRATQNAAQLSAAYATAMSEVGIEASKMAAIEAIAAGEITAQSMAQPDSIVTWGGAGAARAAVIIGLVAAATAAALALVNSLFPESKASETKNRKLSTGMLTYAEGNYPVLGNDGKVYDAKYEGAGMKTGVYGGGAHFGIFSEKQPEMIVDGKTTQKLILNYPYIYDAITTIAKNGRLKNAMPTFATGDYPAGMKQLAPIAEVDASAGGNNEQMELMREELAQSREVNRRLLKAIEGGITAHLDGLETHKQQKKNERFLKRRGID